MRNHKIVELTSYTGEIKIAFYASGDSFNYIYVDNVKIIALPTEPILEVLNIHTWNAGPQLINTTDESGQIFTIRNSGVGTLAINSITDLSATEFETDFDTDITLLEGETYSFSFSYTPTDLVDDNVDFVVTLASGL